MKSLIRLSACVIALCVLCAGPSASAERYIIGTIRGTSEGLSVGPIRLMPVSPAERVSMNGCFGANLCEIKVETSYTGNKFTYISLTNPGRFNSPKEVLDFIYKRYALWPSNVFDVDDNDADKIYMKELADLVVQADQRARQEQEESPANSPWLTAQEWDVRGLKIEVDDLGSGSALGIVRYRNFAEQDPNLITMTYDLRESSEGWRVADIVFPGTTQITTNRFSEQLKAYVKAVPPSPPSRSADKVETKASGSKDPRSDIYEQIFGPAPTSNSSSSTSRPAVILPSPSAGRTPAIQTDPLDKVKITARTLKQHAVDLGTFRQLSQRLQARDGRCEAHKGRNGTEYDAECSYNFRTYGFMLRDNGRGQFALIGLDMDAKTLSEAQRDVVINDVLR